MPYCNVIAFADDVFVLLWKWLAQELRVPAESTYHASKAWTLPSLGAGITSLSASQLSVLALFCQAFQFCSKGENLSSDALDLGICTFVAGIG